MSGDEGTGDSTLPGDATPVSAPSTSGLAAPTVDSVRRVVQEEVRAALAGLSSPVSTTAPSSTTPSPGTTSFTSGKCHVRARLIGYAALFPGAHGGGGWTLARTDHYISCTDVLLRLALFRIFMCSPCLPYRQKCSHVTPPAGRYEVQLTALSREAPGRDLSAYRFPVFWLRVHNYWLSPRPGTNLPWLPCA